MPCALPKIVATLPQYLVIRLHAVFKITKLFPQINLEFFCCIDIFLSIFVIIGYSDDNRPF